MNTRMRIIDQQSRWAKENNIDLVSPYRKEGSDKPWQSGPAYVCDVNRNLFCMMDKEVEEEIESGDGGELRFRGIYRPRMCALHSSSALAFNVFYYWRSQKRVDRIATACDFSSSGIDSLGFEKQYPIDTRFKHAPNLDMAIVYAPGNSLAVVGIESKFCEPYGGTHAGLKHKYLDPRIDKAWDGLSRCRELAKEICPEDKRFKRLHAAQLLKHILGLKNNNRGREVALLYLWYDVPGKESDEHCKDIEQFTRTVKGDIRFQSLTYQELIRRLREGPHHEHRAYIDYLTERYFTHANRAALDRLR